MSNPIIPRALQALKPPICASCRSKLPSSLPLRPFSSTATFNATDKPYMDPMNSLSSINDHFRSMNNNPSSSFPLSSNSSANSLDDIMNLTSVIPQYNGSDPPSLLSTITTEIPRHHLHVYATKHNTHITLTKPNRDALISVSCGNIGFRKAGRGTYDAAYQLAAFVMSRIQDKGLLAQIKQLEVVYRGFGPGREAVTKAIMGSEGRNLRGRIVRLTDSTRLKFGGTRSPAPRRLG